MITDALSENYEISVNSVLCQAHLSTLLAYSLGKKKAEFKSALTFNSDHQAILCYEEMETL